MFSFKLTTFIFSVIAASMMGTVTKAHPVEQQQTWTGDATHFDAALGACGIYNTNSDFIAAVSASYYDSFPGYVGTNPNNNPICGKKIRAEYNGKSVEVAITDRCVACQYPDIDLTPAAFLQLESNMDFVGRIHGVTWKFI